MNIDILTEDQVAQLSHLISTSQNIVITCHRSPDGDAIGSSLGFAAYLWSLGFPGMAPKYGEDHSL